MALFTEIEDALFGRKNSYMQKIQMCLYCFQLMYFDTYVHTYVHTYVLHVHTYLVEFCKATAITSRSEGKMTSALLMSSTSRLTRDEIFWRHFEMRPLA